MVFDGLSMKSFKICPMKFYCKNVIKWEYVGNCWNMFGKHRSALCLAWLWSGAVQRLLRCLRSCRGPWLAAVPRANSNWWTTLCLGQTSTEIGAMGKRHNLMEHHGFVHEIPWVHNHTHTHHTLDTLDLLFFFENRVVTRQYWEGVMTCIWGNIGPSADRPHTVNIRILVPCPTNKLSFESKKPWRDLKKGSRYK